MEHKENILQRLNEIFYYCEGAKHASVENKMAFGYLQGAFRDLINDFKSHKCSNQKATGSAIKYQIIETLRHAFNDWSDADLDLVHKIIIELSSIKKLRGNCLTLLISILELEREFPDE